MEPEQASSRRWWIAPAIGIAVLSFTRIRAQLPWYRQLHVWMAELDVPSQVRNLDAPLLMVIGAFVAARIVSKNPLCLLGLKASIWQGVVFGLVAGAPMVIISAATANGIDFDLQTARGIVLAPFVEEVFFRGLLTSLPIALAGLPFWPTALLSSALFGALHVPWDETLAQHHLWPFLITGIGGLWYAWLVRMFDRNLWHTIALHAVMNAAWLVFAVEGGAVGSGLWPNVGRALTIVAGTVIARRYRRRIRA